MIEAQGLTRNFGPFTAVHGISFSIAEGEIVGILGPNGAGKTTTIRMITGFLPPSTGSIMVGGHDLLTEPRKARREIGYLPENVALYTEMRVREYLAYRAKLEGMKRGDARAAIDSTLRRCLLEDVEWQIIGTLSKGYKQRVGLATAILHDPKVLVLDEPTVGLDPKQIIAIRELIRELGHRRTLLLSTHILPEVETLCDRVFIIDGGRLVAEGTPEELRKQSAGNAVLNLTVKNAPPGVDTVLEGLPGVVGMKIQTHEEETRFQVKTASGHDLRETVFRAAVDQGWTVLELVEKKASLEDIFVRLTRQDGAPAAPPEGALAGSESTESTESTTEEEAS